MIRHLLGILIVVLSCRSFAQSVGPAWGLDHAAGELEVRIAGSAFFAHQDLGDGFGAGAALGIPVRKRIILTAGVIQFFGAEKQEFDPGEKEPSAVTTANGTIATAGVDYQFPTSAFFRRTTRGSELSPFFGVYTGGLFAHVTGRQRLASTIPVDVSSRQSVVCLSGGGRWRPGATSNWGLRFSYQGCKPLSGADNDWVQQLSLELSAIIRRNK